MKPPRTILGETVILAASILALALVANALHPKGLDLGKNYFPVPPPVSDSDSGQASGLQHDFQIMDFDEVQAWQPYAKDEDGGVVILDARGEKDYVEGHIPGSRLCHHYRQELYVPDLLDLMNNADTIIIYCNGGNCEDSIQLATDLVYTHGVNKDALAIFEGGWEQWINADLEVQTGDQP